MKRVNGIFRCRMVVVVGLLLGVSLEFDEEDPQAEKARTSPRTGTTVRLRRTRLLQAL